MNSEQEKIVYSLRAPLLFVGLLWFVKFLEVLLQFDVSLLGIYPRQAFGIIGIATSPLAHGDLPHLVSNSVPLIIMGALLLYFYPKASKKVVPLIYVVTGALVWLLARETSTFGVEISHIGASGVVYGMAFFLFFGGVFRKDVKSLVVSFVVLFLYGSIVYGLSPNQEGISWESHLFGAITGSGLAWWFRKIDLPVKPVLEGSADPTSDISYRYIYRPNDEKNEEIDSSSDQPE